MVDGMCPMRESGEDMVPEDGDGEVIVHLLSSRERKAGVPRENIVSGIWNARTL
jgi:hypothetical protein